MAKRQTQADLIHNIMINITERLHCTFFGDCLIDFVAWKYGLKNTASMVQANYINLRTDCYSYTFADLHKIIMKACQAATNKSCAVSAVVFSNRRFEHSFRVQDAITREDLVLVNVCYEECAPYEIYTFKDKEILGAPLAELIADYIIDVSNITSFSAKNSIEPLYTLLCIEELPIDKVQKLLYKCTCLGSFDYLQRKLISARETKTCDVNYASYVLIMNFVTKHIKPELEFIDIPKIISDMVQQIADDSFPFVIRGANTLDFVYSDNSISEDIRDTYNLNLQCNATTFDESFLDKQIVNLLHTVSKDLTFVRSKSSRISLSYIYTIYKNGIRLFNIIVDKSIDLHYRTVKVGDGKVSYYEIEALIADKVYNISCDRVLQHAVDLYDLYTIISKHRCSLYEVRNFIAIHYQGLCGSWEFVREKSRLLQLAYNDVKGVSNKPSWEECITLINTFLNPFITEIDTNLHWMGTCWVPGP